MKSHLLHVSALPSKLISKAKYVSFPSPGTLEFVTGSLTQFCHFSRAWLPNEALHPLIEQNALSLCRYRCQLVLGKESKSSRNSNNLKGGVGLTWYCLAKQHDHHKCFVNPTHFRNFPANLPSPSGRRRLQLHVPQLHRRPCKALQLPAHVERLGRRD